MTLEYFDLLGRKEEGDSSDTTNTLGCTCERNSGKVELGMSVLHRLFSAYIIVLLRMHHSPRVSFFVLPHILPVAEERVLVHLALQPCLLRARNRLTQKSYLGGV